LGIKKGIKMEIEFKLIDEKELPPMVIAMNDDDKPKVVINAYHRIWIGLHRKVIAGIVVNLQEKMDEMLDGFLREQRANEKLDTGDWE
jgi:hypothetical protein|tara:strand:+ start:2897 stop:3160 length:264 start_codon:yes stop_codon:yes gene_type:complete